MSSGRSLLKNSLSNAINGFSSAVLALGLPPILSRTMEPAAFSAWTLVLQIAAYTAILNLGLQNGISRFVAYHAARSDSTAAGQITSTGFALLTAAAVVAISGIIALAGFLPRLFPQLPETITYDSALTLVIVGITLAAGLPISAFLGSFLGYQRNDLVAWVQGGARLVIALALAIAAIQSSSMITMAAVFAIVYFLSYAVTLLVHHSMGYGLFSTKRVTASAARELWTYSGTLIVWIIATWLINGLDTALVGKFDFQAVGVYGACAGVILVIGGLQQALFGPLLQIIASYQGADRTSEIPALLIQATRLSAILLFTLATPLLLFAEPLLDLWLGPAYSVAGATILRLIVIGSVLRLIWVPYVLVLLATLRHKQVLITPIVEGVVNVVVAVLGGWLYGAPGVAAGVVAGAVVALGMNFLVNMPNTHTVTPDRMLVLKNALLRPLLCFAPAFIVLFTIPSITNTSHQFIAAISGLSLSIVLTWKQGLPADERTLVTGTLRLAAKRIRGAN